MDRGRRIGKDPACIDLLTSGISQQQGLTIDVIADRTATLGELRATLYT